ncbi:MAG: hypothetical protein IPP71_10110 [Bacteroidetes bacterium]|nr:hypothetical protein [Bacteroidota bacterium]
MISILKQRNFDFRKYYTSIDGKYLYLDLKFTPNIVAKKSDIISYYDMNNTTLLIYSFVNYFNIDNIELVEVLYNGKKDLFHAGVPFYYKQEDCYVLPQVKIAY